MTLVKVKKHDFETLNDERLGWVCMEPTFLQIRGKDISVKTKVVAGLTKGQQALCMFRVFYDHAKNSVSEYYAWVSYLLGSSGYWSGVMGGLRYFGDAPMSRLLEETKEILEARKQRLGVEFDEASFKDLEQDDELLNTFNLLFDRFLHIAPNSLKQISTYIRSNPQLYVSIES